MPVPCTAAKVDHLGTDNLVAAALSAGTVKKFVLVTSLLTNAPNIGQGKNSNYTGLNALGGILVRPWSITWFLDTRSLTVCTLYTSVPVCPYTLAASSFTAT